MTMFSHEWFAVVGGAAAVVLLMAVVVTGLVRRRKRAALRQAEAQQAYDARVDEFRETVAQSRVRRGELLRLLEVARKKRYSLALTAETKRMAEDPLLSRFYVDLSDARNDPARREVLVMNLNRALLGVDILIPEPPIPPAPAEGLSKRARRHAEAWHAERSAALGELAALTVPEPAPVTVPSQKKRAPRAKQTPKTPATDGAPSEAQEPVAQAAAQA